MIKNILLGAVIGSVLTVASQTVMSRSVSVHATRISPVITDGYKFTPTIDKPRQGVTVFTGIYPDKYKLNVQAKKAGMQGEVVAFSTQNEDGTRCVIHIVDPKVKYNPTVVGHEFLHCVYGQWHVDNDSYGPGISSVSR